MLRKNEEATLRYALSKVNHLIDAANGKPSPCSVFDGSYGEFTDEQRRIIAAYVSTWIREPLEAVENGIDGDRTFANDSALAQWAAE